MSLYLYNLLSLHATLRMYYLFGLFCLYLYNYFFWILVFYSFFVGLIVLLFFWLVLRERLPQHHFLFYLLLLTALLGQVGEIRVLVP